MNPSSPQIALRIVTPEGVSFALPLASPLRRLYAVMLDLVLVIVLNMAMFTLSAMTIAFAGFFGFAIYFLINFVFTFGYFIFCEWRWKGQTPGKKMMGIQVMDAEGLRLQFSQIVIRNLMRVVDQLPLLYLVGGIAAVLHSQGKRLGDLVANTIVIRKEKLQEPEWDQIKTDKYNSLRKYPHLAGRLRQLATPMEIELALQAILRRTDFRPEERLSLFAFLAEHFKSYKVFPEEAEVGLTDEQYIRNLVELLYSK